MFGQKNWLVILVTSNSLQLVGLGETNVQTIPLPASIIESMEVINKDGLYSLITDWLKQRTYTSASIIWLLAPDICFEKILNSSEEAGIDSEAVQFLDTVPFENVLSRIYLTSEGRVVTAVNKDLVMALVQGFALHGYSAKAILPSRLAMAESDLTPEVENYALKHVGDLARESLLTLSPTPSAPKSSSSPEPVKKPKSSLPLLLSVFGVLLAILVTVIVLNQ